MKTWLKGGLICAGIFILINIIIIFMSGTGWLIPFVPTFPLMWILTGFNVKMLTMETFYLEGLMFSIFINTIFFFIIGAIIGLIIQKMKR